MITEHLRTRLSQFHRKMQYLNAEAIHWSDYSYISKATRVTGVDPYLLKYGNQMQPVGCCSAGSVWFDHIKYLNEDANFLTVSVLNQFRNLV